MILVITLINCVLQVFTLDDSQGVLDSDIFFYYRQRGYEDEGGSWKHGIAFACNLLKEQNLDVKRKILIYIDETAVPFPLHFGSVSLTFNDLEIAASFLNSINSLDKRDYIKSWMSLLDKERAR